eukprot:656537-Rhodomonas_salina.1
MLAVGAVLETLSAQYQQCDAGSPRRVEAIGESRRGAKRWGRSEARDVFVGSGEAVLRLEHRLRARDALVLLAMVCLTRRVLFGARRVWGVGCGVWGERCAMRTDTAHHTRTQGERNKPSRTQHRKTQEHNNSTPNTTHKHTNTHGTHLVLWPVQLAQHLELLLPHPPRRLPRPRSSSSAAALASGGGSWAACLRSPRRPRVAHACTHRATESDRE